MRGLINLAVAASTLAAGGCDGGGFALEPLTVEGYGSFDANPVMAGGELWASAIFYTDYDEHTRATRVTVTPPELADVTLVEDGDFLVIHARAQESGTARSPLTYPEDGYGSFHVELESGYSFDQRFWVEPAVSSTIEAAGVPLSYFPERRLPGDRLAVFEGERLSLSLRHRTAEGLVALGHDDSAWSADGIQLAEIEMDAYDAYPYYDRSLLRYGQAIAAGSATIRAGSSSLAVDVVPQKTTARIEAIGNGATSFDAAHPLHMNVGESPSLTVFAYTDDGRYIFGGSPFIPVVVTSSDDGVVQPRDGQTVTSRTVRLDGYRSGTATLTITFDGLSIDVPVTVD
jgi:hypothetical protein